MSASTHRSPCEKVLSLNVGICRDMLERSVNPLVGKADPHTESQGARSVGILGVVNDHRQCAGSGWSPGRAETWQRSEAIRSIRSLVFAPADR
jgi:hypothetical protein